MTFSITRYNLKDFKELIPLLMRCFPDFWAPRLAEGKYSFPYDLKLFTARLEGRLMGCIGVHEYVFRFEGSLIRCGGVCDVAVDPEFRGRGYASELQKFFLRWCRKHYTDTSLTALYTDKPAVYTRLGWQIYAPDRSTEIPTEAFPRQKSFQFDSRKISLAFLRGKSTPRNAEEKKAREIMKIYDAGKIFDGKCLRSAKSWWEIFAAPDHHWRLEDDAFFLWKNNTLLEAYSTDPGHPVACFTPRHGALEAENKIMTQLPCPECGSDKKIAAALNKGLFVFPAADIF